MVSSSLSIQNSSPAPFMTYRSAWESFTIKEGVGSNVWGSAPGGTTTVTSTRSPPTARTRSARGAMVAATLIRSPDELDSFWDKAALCSSEDMQPQRAADRRIEMSINFRSK